MTSMGIINGIERSRSSNRDAHHESWDITGVLSCCQDQVLQSDPVGLFP